MANISGTKDNDILDGTADKDVINGFIGADTMRGGANDDTYFVDNAKDKVVELQNDGHEIVFSTVTVAKLWDNVEDLTLIGKAVGGTGNELNNLITGNDYNNLLDGGTNSDVLIGGKGNDTYIVDHANDTVVEQKGEGIDLIKSSVDYTASGWVENLTLTGKDNIFGNGNALDNVLTGNGGNNLLVGGEGSDTMSGGKGNDTYSVDDIGDVVIESAGQGMDTVNSAANFKLGANIENLALAGAAEYGTGNVLDNTITGTDLSNRLDGGKGADTLIGGKGNDYYFIDNAGDKVTESKNEGDEDVVYSSITITKLFDNVEDLALSGTAALNATGNDLDNSINGNTGKNTIDGGLGADLMAGGKGNDTYIVDNAGDKVTESKDEGIDLVKSSVAYTLGADMENLTLTGTDSILGFGNKLDNVLTGNDGGNFLNGGLGKDTMIGGKGSDQYAVDDVGDKVIESVTNANGGGIDSVFSSVDFSLAALGNIDRLYLNGDAAKATGNALDNIIEGTNQGNVIDGGKGADAMAGFKGWDTYYVDNAGDTVTESKDGDTDTVISSIALTSAFDNVERYTFNTGAAVNFTANALDNTVNGGSGKDTLDGAAGNDHLHGNNGDDTLHGGAGNDDLMGDKGADAMDGGSGNDYYEVDNVKDTVIEGLNGGDDYVASTISLTHLFDNVEDARLAGIGNINLTGNSLDNGLIGNDGKNTIDGGAGKDEIEGHRGNDILIGGDAADTFLFDLSPKDGPNDGHDTIKDFVKTEDVLDISSVEDRDGSGKIDLDDLLASCTVSDHGSGKDVDVIFDNGAIVTFTGAGTGNVNSITDLVANAAQIHVD